MGHCGRTERNGQLDCRLLTALRGAHPCRSDLPPTAVPSELTKCGFARLIDLNGPAWLNQDVANVLGVGPRHDARLHQIIKTRGHFPSECGGMDVRQWRIPLRSVSAISSSCRVTRPTMRSAGYGIDHSLVLQ